MHFADRLGPGMLVREIEGIVTEATALKGTAPLVPPEYVDLFQDGTTEQGLTADLVFAAPVLDHPFEVYREPFLAAFEGHLHVRRTEADLPFGLIIVEEPDPTVAVVVYGEGGERRSFAYRSPSDGEADRAFVRSVYAARAEDIAGFVTIPAAILDLDADATDRAVADLVAYRARQLLIDDIEDVAVDRHDGIETSVAWLLATRERDAAALLRSAYDSFESGDPPAPYSDALQRPERDDAIVEGLADPDADPAR